MKGKHPVRIGKGNTKANSIEWVDCTGAETRRFVHPPYWVDKNDNCKMTADAFGIEEKGGTYIVVNEKEFTKYFRVARNGDEVSFERRNDSIILATKNTRLQLLTGVNDEIKPRRAVELANNQTRPDIEWRLAASARVLVEIMGTADLSIPADIVEASKCIIVVPSPKKTFAIGDGKSRGKGVATCRTATDWSAPAPITVTGGSWGLQLGGQATDLVMLVMNQKGMDHLLSSKFEVGADASAAAGPVGRHASSDTDWKMKSEVLTYSRSRGAFSGIDLSGAAVTQDKDGSSLLYGKRIGIEEILRGKVSPPQSTDQFLGAVRKMPVENGWRN